MKSLSVLVVLLLGVATFEGILSATSPKCYKNVHGMCRTFENPSLAESDEALNWELTTMEDCANREENETKVCSSECDLYREGFCYPAGNHICGFSESDDKCKIFYNLCAFKQSSCQDAAIKDWRMVDMALCKGLKITDPAGKCKKE